MRVFLNTDCVIRPKGTKEDFHFHLEVLYDPKYRIVVIASNLPLFLTPITNSTFNLIPSMFEPKILKNPLAKVKWNLEEMAEDNKAYRSIQGVMFFTRRIFENAFAYGIELSKVETDYHITEYLYKILTYLVKELREIDCTDPINRVLLEKNASREWKITTTSVD